MTEKPKPEPQTIDPNTVWTYRGYQMRSGEFNTAMVHFYRGEVTRANTWRNRLDSTTNWAVVTTAAVLTFSFSSVTNSHVVVLISMLLVLLFWFIEARRYRYYELWTYRVRVMETEFFAGILSGKTATSHNWADDLIESLLMPRYPVSLLTALGRRLRRNYIWLLLILGLAWLLKLMLHPIPAHSADALIRHAGVGLISGYLIFWLVVLSYIIILSLALSTSSKMKAASDDIKSHINRRGLLSWLTEATHVLSEENPFRQRHSQQLAIIITDKPEQVSHQLMTFLGRGVTAIEGMGMYTKTPRTVLLCALDPTQVDELRTYVYNTDENAVVVVNSANEVLGGGFEKLKPEWRDIIDDD